VLHRYVSEKLGIFYPMPANAKELFDEADQRLAELRSRKGKGMNTKNSALTTEQAEAACTSARKTIQESQEAVARGRGQGCRARARASRRSRRRHAGPWPSGSDREETGPCATRARSLACQARGPRAETSGGRKRTGDSPTCRTGRAASHDDRDAQRPYGQGGSVGRSNDQTRPHVRRRPGRQHAHAVE
jgi:hypothetical protein